MSPHEASLCLTDVTGIETNPLFYPCKLHASCKAALEKELETAMDELEAQTQGRVVRMLLPAQDDLERDLEKAMGELPEAL